MGQHREAPEGGDTGDTGQADTRTLPNRLQQEPQPRQGRSPQSPHSLHRPRPCSPQRNWKRTWRRLGTPHLPLAHTHPAGPTAQRGPHAGRGVAGSGPLWTAPCLLQAAVAMAMASRTGSLRAEGRLPRVSRGSQMCGRCCLGPWRPRHALHAHSTGLSHFLTLSSGPSWASLALRAPFLLCGHRLTLARLGSHLGTSGPGLRPLRILWGLSRPGPA